MSSDYRDADDETIDELIEASRETATERRVNAAVEREQAAKDKALKNQDEKYAEEIEKMRDDIEDLKEANKNQLEDFKKQLEEIDKKSRENEKEARQKEREKHIEIEAKAIARIKKVWYVIAFLLCIIIPISGAIFGIQHIWKMPELNDTASTIISVIGSLAALIIELIVFKVLYENWFCELKYTNIVEREKNKLEDKYPKTE